MAGVFLAVAVIALTVGWVAGEAVAEARRRTVEAETARDQAITEAVEMADLVRSLTGPSPFEDDEPYPTRPVMAAGQEEHQR